MFCCSPNQACCACAEHASPSTLNNTQRPGHGHASLQSPRVYRLIIDLLAVAWKTHINKNAFIIIRFCRFCRFVAKAETKYFGRYNIFSRWFHGRRRTKRICGIFFGFVSAPPGKSGQLAINISAHFLDCRPPLPPSSYVCSRYGRREGESYSKMPHSLPFCRVINCIPKKDMFDIFAVILILQCQSPPKL